MDMVLFAVEIDADWLKGLGVLAVGVISAFSYAFVRMYRAWNSGRNTNATTDIAVDESKDKRKAKRQSTAWTRMNALFVAQDEREKTQDKKIEEQDKKIEELTEKARKHEIEAAECRQREIEHERRDKERDLENAARDKRIRDLEQQLGLGSKEHTPLRTEQ